MSGKIEKIFDIVPQGTGGRWALGTVILIYLVAYNETSGPIAVFSTLLAAFYGFVSAMCRNGTKNLQIAYIRASNKFDFICIFLSLWFDALAILTACSILARTLSICVDTMTGGLARILILGRNSPVNEPWPDVLGVGVVFLITGMFMLGLENSKAFSIIMTISMLGINGIVSCVSWYNGDYKEWDKNYFLPNGLYSLLTASAISTFSYPTEMPNIQGWKRLLGLLLILLVCGSTFLAAGCLSTIVHLKTAHEYVAVPLFSILDENNFKKFIAAAACLLLLTSSAAFLELFPELYQLIVRFSTTEFKILSRQINYESPDSGNPILAIFIAGSLCAIMAFAAPLQNLTHIMAASHLFSGLIKAFYLLYFPFRPKFMQHSVESSLSYSRLPAANQNLQGPSGRRSNNWRLSGQKSNRKNKKKIKNDVDKEWLLLGEPSSPCQIPRDQDDLESTILSDAEPSPTDFEFPGRVDNSDSDTSTDIDAIVDEYREKVKVTTAGPIDRSSRLPSIASWRVTIFAIMLIIFGIGLILFGIHCNLLPAYITGLIGIFLVSVVMSFIPKYNGNIINVSPIICSISLTLGSIFLSSCLIDSWPALLFWILAGLCLVLRCDTWCCSCFEIPSSDDYLIAQRTRKAAIRLPRPPKGIVIPGRIPNHHQNRNR
ncbi:probable cationic amino acid transporter isoform X2 [Condylostylus longicornis]|uniref:probable cationic amino acid transporter isoform X2 n=1 Tax=Condylostylus longicornis TaxID=2530218 RepID=UPI00244DEBDF|nr:probable cationic amino acid transporter isoform X2 [Condylostylus longicornis]